MTSAKSEATLAAAKDALKMQKAEINNSKETRKEVDKAKKEED